MTAGSQTLIDVAQQLPPLEQLNLIRILSRSLYAATGTYNQQRISGSLNLWVFPLPGSPPLSWSRASLRRWWRFVNGGNGYRLTADQRVGLTPLVILVLV